MFKKISGTFVFICVFLFFKACAVHAQSIPTVRIDVLNNISTLHIEGNDLMLIDTYRNLYIYKNNGYSYIIVSATNNGIMVNKKIYPTRLVTLLFSKGIIRINGKLLRGHLEIAVLTSDRLVVINEVDLESYVAGIVNAEMPHNWSIEALKAQAVVARTYAMWQKERHLNDYYDMSANFMDQVYDGAESEDKKGWEAVNSTKGEIITYHDKPILAMYHAICGGETENSEDAVGHDYPYLRTKKCDFCRFAPGFNWKYTISFNELTRRLIANGYRLSGVYGFAVLKRSRTKRVMTARIVIDHGYLDLDGTTLRSIVGYDKLRSTLFWFRIKHGDILFNGRGFGHGVGMCQWGAYGMAKKGYNYKQIIHYYYTDVHIKKFY
ncbi:MAG: SpoIID/LytB domain-containing protein [Deltaproteobacteria bacterium]|nr:SpoIID/LytB domain-containing protein [Deltaproteobacteria bacterium]MCL5792434.1 SpoIID/LytB domain-containing protein [Deltaproteobacteria bacterium]